MQHTIKSRFRYRILVLRLRLDESRLVTWFRTTRVYDALAALGVPDRYVVSYLIPRKWNNKTEDFDLFYTPVEMQRVIDNWPVT